MGPHARCDGDSHLASAVVRSERLRRWSVLDHDNHKWSDDNHDNNHNHNDDGWAVFRGVSVDVQCVKQDVDPDEFDVWNRVSLYRPVVLPVR